MDHNEKFRLEQHTKQKYWLLRFKMGCKAIVTDGRKACIIIAYTLLVVLLWFYQKAIFQLGSNDLFAWIKTVGVQLLIPLWAVIGAFYLIALLGMPFGSRAINDNLRRIGLTNHAGESPLLMAKRKDKANPKVSVLEFEANGIPLSEWEKEREKIESALNIHMVKIVQGKDMRRILLYVVSAQQALPDRLTWRDVYLRNRSFELVAGENYLGQVTVDLAKIPHILIGGSTGSGKSLLLKLLLMQCIKKGAYVYIADFKGGVDFPLDWYKHCEMLFEKELVYIKLSGLVYELEHRKQLFKSRGCANICEYKQLTGSEFPRWIFACDEIAELLDKTGCNKEEKALISKIESELSTIARQGRAFGIHLILATQRPDATILAGQIRNNMDCRICGRADNVLSQIILDHGEASHLIPKDAQGRFLMHDGTVFQGYLFNEKKAFG